MIVATRQAPTAETAMIDIDQELVVTAGMTATTGISHVMKVETMAETEDNANVTNMTIATAVKVLVEIERGTNETTMSNAVTDMIITKETSQNRTRMENTTETLTRVQMQMPLVTTRHTERS